MPHFQNDLKIQKPSVSPISLNYSFYFFQIHDDLEKEPEYSGSGFGPDDEDSTSSTTHQRKKGSFDFHTLICSLDIDFTFYKIR